jgi:CRP-like cAMP-binding protein
VKIPDPAKQLGTMDKLLRLHASPLFKEIPPQRLVELARRSELRLYQAGEIICAADTPSDRLWLLISGSAQLGKSKLTPGRSIGEMAVLTNSNYPDTAIATGPKNLTLVITAASFNELIANDSLVARTLLALVSRRWRPKTSTSVPAYLP